MKNEELESYYNQIQLDLANKIDLSNKIDIKDIKLVSGIDLAYWNKNNIDYAVCSIIIMDYNTKQIVETKSLIDKITVPYIAGYLSFRELPLIEKTFKLIENMPDIVLFDGNGYLHYRNMGIATHASFSINKPTIGVAKSYLKIENTEFIMPEDKDGAYTNIVINNKIYGRAVRTHKGVKPIFVSCGNWITIDSATDIVLSLICKESRQPLPTRLADIETKKQRKKFLEDF